MPYSKSGLHAVQVQLTIKKHTHRYRLESCLSLPNKYMAPKTSGQLVAADGLSHKCNKNDKTTKAATAEKCNPKRGSSFISMKIACWNVRTLIDNESRERPHRRTALIARELSRYDIDIAGLSETRLSEDGQLTEELYGYTFFWKGRPAGERRDHGVGFAIKTSIAKNLHALPFGKSERQISLRLPLEGGRFVSVVCAYAPTMGHSEADILSFYAELKQSLSGIPREDKIVLLGDFNARVGRDHGTWSCLGPEGIGGSNSNGLQLLQLCNELNLAVGNTWFRQRDKYKGTWKHPRSDHWHMIDFVIVRRRDLRDLHSVRTMRGAECWTDHRLVRAKVALRIRPRARHNTVPCPRRLDTAKLRSEGTKALFVEAIDQLPALGGADAWGDFRSGVYSAAERIVGIRRRKSRDWFAAGAEEIDNLLETKQQLLRRTLVATPHGDATREYRSFRTHTQRRMREIQNLWWVDRAAEIQLAADTGNTKALYSLLKEVYGPRQATFAPLKSKDGAETYTQPADIQKRWCQHYEELLNRHPTVDESVLRLVEQRDVIHSLDDVPTRAEIELSVSQMNDNRAPGVDCLTAEILKNGGERMFELLEVVIRDVWGRGAPQDWRDAVLVSIYKGGAKSECGNFRGISLLSVVGKMFSRVIMNRLTAVLAERILPESQCGFRAGRGTVDMIFSVRQLQEKCREQNVPLYHCFIDLSKAFDSVNRDTLWKILLRLGCPERFVAILRSLHEGMRARVDFNGSLSEPFPVENGVKQGDVLAPTLFLIYFAVVFRVAFRDDPDGIYVKYRTSGRVFNLRRLLSATKVSFALIRDLLYADDCDIVAHTETKLQLFMDSFSGACRALGLEINLKKTVVMHEPAPKQPYVEPSILVEGRRLRVVQSFVYLGSTLAQGGGLDNEISLRIQRASGSFANLEGRLWSRHGIKMATKIAVYRACVLTALL